MPEFQYYINLQPSETTDHLFWDCQGVQVLIQQSYRWIRGLDWLRGNEVTTKDIFFQGINNTWTSLSYTDLIWKHFVKYFIYIHKHMHKLPTFPNLKYELEGLFSTRRMALYSRTILNINVLYIND
jgi:hypothetical protein